MSLTQPFHHVLPVHEDLFNGGLYVTHVGWERVEPGETYPKQLEHPGFYHFAWEEGRILPEFCLSHVLAGEGEAETGSGVHALRRGSTFLICPGEWYRHRPTAATGWSLAWIHFNGGLPCQWQQHGAFGHSFPQVADEALFLQEFERLLLSAHAAPTRNSLQLSWQAIGLLSHLSPTEAKHTPSRQAKTGDPQVDRAVEHIWNYSHGMLDVPGVIAAVGLSRRSLERRFKTARGHGLLDEIQQCRFTRAAWLLKETDLPVKIIVGRAGFGSHEQMRLAFRKRTGGTPEAYRTR